MKVLVIYNSVDPQSVAGAMLAKLRYHDCTLKDIYGIATADITTYVNGLSQIYDLIINNYDVDTDTGKLSVAQVLILDSKINATAVMTGTATASSSVATLTDANSGWTVNAYAGMYVKTTGGTGLNQVRQIVSNTSQVLTLDSAWTVAIDTNTTFTIMAERDNFSHTIAATSGQLKRAILAWQHETLFSGIPEPLLIYKLAGDKTTADTTTNAQDVLDASYMVNACKFFGRNLADQAVRQAWSKLLFNGTVPDPTKLKQPPFDQALYNTWYAYGKLMTESATALSVTL